MKKIDKILTVFDYGSYISLAITLIPFFKEVKYYCVHSADFPKSNEAQIGKNVPGLTWVDDFDEVIAATDIFFFPDCRDAGKQMDLRRRGKQVFGSGRGIELENDRFYSNEVLKEVGLPAVKMKRIKGKDALVEYIKNHKGHFYLKGNFRGDFETQRIDSYELNYSDLNELFYTLANANDYEFICCEPIDGDDVVEIGVDTFCINGQFPESMMYGLEIKDLGYVGVVKKSVMLSKYLLEPIQKLTPVFKEYGEDPAEMYCNSYSNELRIKGKTGYLTDQTCRCPEPPSSLYFSMISNLGEFIDEGSKGNMIQPIYTHKYGAHAVITNCGSKDVVRPIKFPAAIKDFVRVKNLTIIDGIYTYVPLERVSMTEMGSIIAYDNTMEGAIKKLKQYADQVEGNVKINTGSSDSAMKEVEKCKQIGIIF